MKHLDAHGSEQVVHGLALRREAFDHVWVFLPRALVLRVNLMAVRLGIAVHDEGDVGWASALAHTDHNVDQALDGVRVKAFAGRHFRDCVEASTEAIAPVED